MKVVRWNWPDNSSTFAFNMPLFQRRFALSHISDTYTCRIPLMQVMKLAGWSYRVIQCAVTHLTCDGKCGMGFVANFLENTTVNECKQVAQLSQRNRAAGWVSFGRVMAWIRQYSAPNVVGAWKLKALLFYTINPLSYEKRSLCVFEPLFRGKKGS